MGNCCSGDVAGGRQAVGGAATSVGTGATGRSDAVDAVDHFLKSRGGFRRPCSQIEVCFPIFVA